MRRIPEATQSNFVVSMKSGLEGRNNYRARRLRRSRTGCLNEVRPRRPEQFGIKSMSTSAGYNCLNEVRPRRPEQSVRHGDPSGAVLAQVSMKSGLEGRNNVAIAVSVMTVSFHVSMKSGLEGRNNSAKTHGAGSSGNMSQ